jgi:hypothetical protein
VNRTRDASHPCHPCHTSHPILSHSIRSPHDLLTLIPLKKSIARFIHLLFYETFSWRNACCACALHFLMWIEPATPATPAKYPIPSSPITFYPSPSPHTHTYPAQKINGSLHTSFCSIKYFLDEMCTVYVRRTFWKYVNMWIWNIEI